MDQNKDGKITIEELLNYVKEDGSSVPESVQRTMFVLSDSDNSKSIDKKEVVRFLRLAVSIERGEFDSSIFKIADTNFDGVVEQKELQKICKLLGWKASQTKTMNQVEFKEFVQSTLCVEKNWAGINKYEYLD